MTMADRMAVMSRGQFCRSAAPMRSTRLRAAVRGRFHRQRHLFDGILEEDETDHCVSARSTRGFTSVTASPA